MLIITCDVDGYYGDGHFLGVLSHLLLWGGEGEGEVKVSIHPLMNQVLISLIPNRDTNKTSDW